LPGNIREQLAAEDEAFRGRNSPRLLERLFGTSTYHRVYGTGPARRPGTGPLAPRQCAHTVGRPPTTADRAFTFLRRVDPVPQA
jgi:hypothetical protein